MLIQLAVSPVIGSGDVSPAPLPAVSAATFVDLPYAPALLLHAPFSAVITNDSAFENACAEGFEMYLFEARAYAWADLIEYVMAAAAPWDMRGVPATPVVWSAGFMLGWLSAHALVDRPAALMALEVVYSLIELPLSVAAKGEYVSSL